MSGFAPRSGALPFSISKPMKRKEKPKTNSPTDLRLLFCENNKGMPMASNGNEKADTDTLKPNAEIIQAVTVVPMLAPMITPMDWDKVSRPAFTKLTTMTVVAEEDWMSAVMSTPVSTPVTRLVVIAVKILRRRSPANFCNPSLMIFIPYRKSAKEPSSFKKS